MRELKLASAFASVIAWAELATASSALRVLIGLMAEFLICKKWTALVDVGLSLQQLSRGEPCRPFYPLLLPHGNIDFGTPKTLSASWLLRISSGHTGAVDGCSSRSDQVSR